MGHRSSLGSAITAMVILPVAPGAAARQPHREPEVMVGSLKSGSNKDTNNVFGFA